MIRGTTPTCRITTDIDLTPCTDIYINFKQHSPSGDIELEKALPDITVDQDGLSVQLTQADTLAFSDGIICVQVRAKFGNGDAVASQIMHTTISDILREGEI